MRLRRAGSTSLDKPRGFDFHLTASLYNFHWYYDGARLYLCHPSGVVEVREERGALRVTAYGELSACEAAEYASWSLGLDEDLNDFHESLVDDPILRYVPEKLTGLRVRSLSPWLASVVAVCQQRASFLQGWRMLYRLFDLYGRRVKLEGDGETLMPPSPSDILARPGGLREARVGFRDRALLGLARAFAEGLPCDDPGGFEENLVSIKGVGRYTARLARVLGLRSYEEPPIDDWTVKLVSEAFGVEPRAKEVETFLKERYGPYAGLAVLMYTVVLDAEVIGRALERVRKGLVYPLELERPTPLTLWRYREFGREKNLRRRRIRDGKRRS